MRALVHHGEGAMSWDQVPDPVPTDDLDAVVGIEAVTICGTDLHMYDVFGRAADTHALKVLLTGRGS